MKNVIFSAILGVSLLALTGCTDASDAEVSKCQSGKSDSTKKCQSSGSSKCGS